MGSVRCFLMALLLWVLAFSNPSAQAGLARGPEVEQGSAQGRAFAAWDVGEGRDAGLDPPPEPSQEEKIPSTFGPIVTDTAVPAEKGQFLIQPILGYSFVGKFFNERWERISAGHNLQSFSMDWKLVYGLMENVEVFAVIPYAHKWAFNVFKAGSGGETSANSGGLADINLTLKYRLVEERGCLPTITALFATDFPTGKFKHTNPAALNTDVLGGGAYVFTPGFNVSRYIKPFILYGNLWYSMQTSYTDDASKAYPGDFLTVNLAAEYPVIGKWVALLELTSFWGGGRIFGPEANLPKKSLLSVIPGIEYMATDKLSVALGLNVDLVGKDSDAAITPLLSMIYAF